MAANARSETADSADARALPGDADGLAVETQPAPLLDAAMASTPPVPSPAHDLQRHLDTQLTGFSFQLTDTDLLAGTGRWSMRRTLAFVVISNGLAWTALAWLAAAILAG
ncbi:hypothetical protein AB6B38_03380 [Glycocaulis abyssi]|uniref:Uncharacterized protein n=1 Tax=Glycocaulis abyssi TaxID=1433403 RepID=A0ABV9N805_9PROT